MVDAESILGTCTPWKRHGGLAQTASLSRRGCIDSRQAVKLPEPVSERSVLPSTLASCSPLGRQGSDKECWVSCAVTASERSKSM